MTINRPADIYLIITASPTHPMIGTLTEHLIDQGYRFEILMEARGRFPAQQVQSQAAIWLVDTDCVTAYSSSETPLRDGPILAIQFPEAASTQLPKGGYFETVIHSEPDDAASYPALLAMVDEWLREMVPARDRIDFRRQHIYSLFTRLLRKSSLLFDLLPHCNDSFSALLERAERTLTVIPTQLVEYTDNIDETRSALRVDVEDIRTLLPVRSHLALMGTRDQGCNDLMMALTIDTIVDALAIDNALVPLWVSLADWQASESLEALLQRVAPVLSTTAARSWNFRLMLVGLSSEIAFDNKRMQDLHHWLEDETRILEAVVAIPPELAGASVKLGLPVVEMPRMSPEQLHAYCDGVLSNHQGEIFWSWVKETKARLPRTPFHANALIHHFQANTDHSLPTLPDRLTERRVQLDWNRAESLPIAQDYTWEQVSQAIADLAFRQLKEDWGEDFLQVRALEVLEDETLIHIAQAAGWLQATGPTLRFSYDAIERYFAAIGIWLAGLPTVLIYPQFDIDDRRIRTRWDPALRTLAHIFDAPRTILNTIAAVDPLLAYDIAQTAPGLKSAHSGLLAQVAQTFSDQPQVLLPVFDRLSEIRRRDTLLALLGHENRDVRQAALSIMQERLTAHSNFYNADWFHELRKQIETTGSVDANTLLALAVGACQLRVTKAKMCIQLLAQVNHPGRTAIFEWALMHHESVIAIEAIRALSGPNARQAVLGLLYALDHPGTDVRHIAQQTIQPYVTVAQAEFSEFVADGPSETALLHLLDLLSTAAGPNKSLIMQLVNHPQANVACRALELLVYFKREAVMGRIEQAQDDDRFATNYGRKVRDFAKEIYNVFSGQSEPIPLEPDPNTPEKRTPSNRLQKISTSEMLKARLKQEKESNRSTTLRDTLRSTNIETRRAAADEVAELPPEEALIYLPILLHDSDTDIAQQAAWQLGQIKNDEAIRILADGLADVSRTMHHRIIHILQTVGDNARDPLMAVLEHPSANTRAASASILGHLKAYDAIEPIGVMLHDRQYAEYHTAYVSDIAAQALERMGSNKAQELVTYWRNLNEKPEPEAQVEPIAAQAEAVEQEQVEETDSILDDMPIVEQPTSKPVPQALVGLLENLEAAAWGDRERAARRVYEYVREHPTENILPPIVEYSRHDEWVIRWSMTECMAWIRKAEVVEPLASMLLDNEWMIRVAAIRSITEQTLPDKNTEMAIPPQITADIALPLLRPLIEDENASVREAAVDALGTLNDPMTIPALSVAMDDEEPHVRFIAVQSLAQFDSRRVGPLLTKALSDNMTDIRWIAAQRLGELSDERAVPFLAPCLRDSGSVSWAEERLCDIAAIALTNIGTDEALNALEEDRVQ